MRRKIWKKKIVRTLFQSLWKVEVTFLLPVWSRRSGGELVSVQGGNTSCKNFPSWEGNGEKVLSDQLERRRIKGKPRFLNLLLLLSWISARIPGHLSRISALLLSPAPNSLQIGEKKGHKNAECREVIADVIVVIHYQPSSSLVILPPFCDAEIALSITPAF